jgi:hypothetical protein
MIYARSALAALGHTQLFVPDAQTADGSSRSSALISASRTRGRRSTMRRADSRGGARKSLLRTLAAVKPPHVAAYVEGLQLAKPTVKRQPHRPESDIQRVSGHRSVAILRRYVRRANVFETHR